jgi:UDP-2,3-diacylglucosamine pyrophosphatase LpxH
VVGDFIDVWSLKRAIHWPQLHNDVIQKVLRKGRKGTRVIYIPGNHDEFIASFFGNYGSIEIMRHAIHETADGRRLLVMHGHELDTVIQTMKWMAFVGDVGYQLLLRLNGPVNRVRQLMGLGYWSLSQHVKKSVKNAVSFVGRFEDAVARYAKEHEVSGVVCGHIHTPVIRRIGDFDYYNTGDWVESCTALVEHPDGRMELVCELPREHVARKPAPPRPAPVNGEIAAGPVA